MAIRPKQTTQNHLKFLDNLNDTGFANMLGSAKYLAKNYNLPADIARDIVLYWYETNWHKLSASRNDN